MLPSVTGAEFSHHFQDTGKNKEWNCWVWEGSGTHGENQEVPAGGFSLYPALRWVPNSSGASRMLRPPLGSTGEGVLHVCSAPEWKLP